VKDPLFNKYNITPFDKDLFYSDKIDQFKEIYYKKDYFWTITAIRLIYIENFLRIYGKENMYHFENDVLLYYSLKEFDNIFQKKYSHLAITTGGDHKCMTGFLFIKNYEALSLMTQFFVDLLRACSESDIRRTYGVDMVHEMSLMRIYGLKKGDIYLSHLPTMPNSPDFHLFNSLFDPAAWGQFVGGTIDGIPGVKPADHYISRMLITNPSYIVIWKDDEKGRHIPYFRGSGEDIRINNLHIHSKNLSKYTS
jgi:hypothetical protein